MSTFWTIILSIILIFTTWIIYYIYRFYRVISKIKNRKLEYKEPNLNVPISKKTIPEKIDHIIIGSGPSGLALAVILSKLGKKFVVLE